MSLFTGEKSTRNGNNTLNNKNMIKRIYYYFKLKELLKMKGLMPFVNYLLELKPEPENLFIYCMKKRRPIIHWFYYLVRYDKLNDHAKIFASGRYPESSVRYATETLTKRFNQANDIWRKTVKVY